MSAAAHALHDDLHIDFINGTGADMYLPLEVRQYEAGLDAPDVQQLIGRLGPDDRGIGQVLRRTDGDGKALLVDFGLAHSVRLGLVPLGILPEHLADPGHVRAVAAQERRRLKGAHPGFYHEIVGVYHDAGVHAVGLLRADPDIVIGVLQDLRHHLAGGGGIGLHIGEGGVLNGLRALPVMIQHHHGLTVPKEIRTFRDGRLVHIHHHQDGIAPGGFDGLLVADDHVALILRVPLEQLHHGLDCRDLVVQHDVGLAPQGQRDPIDAHGCAEAVRVRHPVAHHQHLVLARDNLPKGMGLHAGLHAGILLHLLALAAIVGDALRRLDDGLVAAPAQGQIDGIAGEFIVLGIGQAVQPYADADGHRHLVADIDRLDLLQQVEAGLLELGHRPLAHDGQVLVLLQLLADAVEGGDVFVHLPVDQRNQKGAAHLFHAVQRR